MQTSPCGNNYISYTIQRGQTLYAIARQFNTTVADILAANPALDVQLYYAGDVICIPRPGTTCQNGTAYTIRRGDSFYLIAQRYGIPLASLLAANPGVDPARLQVGQVICVPTVTPQPTPPPPQCPAGSSAHTVTRGQTFVDILVLYNISYAALTQANPTANLNALQIGDTLSTMATRFTTTIGAILMANPTLAPTDFAPGRIICLPEGARIPS